MDNKEEENKVVTKSAPVTSRISTGLGVKVIGSTGIKSPAAGSTGRTLVRGSRVSTVAKKEEQASGTTLSQADKEEEKSSDFDNRMSFSSIEMTDPQPRGSMQGSRSSLSLGAGGVAKKCRTTALSEKDLELVMAQVNETAPPTNNRSTIALPNKDEIIHEVDEDEDSPKSSKKNKHTKNSPRGDLDLEDHDDILKSMMAPSVSQADISSQIK